MLKIPAALFGATLMTLSGTAGLTDVDRFLQSEDTQSVIEEDLDLDGTPGMSGVVTDGTDCRYYGYGRAGGSKPNEYTLYELGSNTKAFTALAVLMLEDEGKLALDAEVSSYIPWFTVTYDDKPAAVTVRQVMQHQAGFDSAVDHQCMQGTDNALCEMNVRNLSGTALAFEPGSQFAYSNVGYDLLGCLIAHVSGESYPDYVTNHILKPLGMTNSGFGIRTTTGYRPVFGKAQPYTPPAYAGCQAAGGLVSCPKDMGLWLNAQLGAGDIPEQLRRAIERSHTVEPTDINIAPEGRTPVYYTCGWNASGDGKTLSHAGANAVFGSDIIIDLEQQIAVCMQSNGSAEPPAFTAELLMAELRGTDPPIPDGGRAAYMDVMASFVFVFIILLYIINLILYIFQNRIVTRRARKSWVEAIRLSVRLLLCAGGIVCLTAAPAMYHMTFAYMLVWFPPMVVYSMMAGVVYFVIKALLSVRRFLLHLRFRLFHVLFEQFLRFCHWAGRQ